MVEEGCVCGRAGWGGWGYQQSWITNNIGSSLENIAK